MAFSIIAHAIGYGDTSATPVDTTGATLYIVAQCGTTPTSQPNDTAGNGYNLKVSNPAGAFGETLEIWTCESPITGTTTHWVPNVNFGSSIVALAVSGSATTPTDQTGTSTSLTAASITPSQNNELIVAVFGTGNTTPGSVNQSFTISDEDSGVPASNFALAMSYLIQGTAAAVSPTYSPTATGSSLLSDIISFKAAAAGTSDQIDWYRRPDFQLAHRHTWIQVP